ncbi:MAG: phage protein [Reyranella sp.]|nr:phage protein [Reyranella sp.]
MRDLVPATPAPLAIAAMSPAAIDRVRQLETLAMALPQIAIGTDHVFHAGVYARTIKVPAGVMITGVLIKIPTLLIVHGDAIVHVEDGPLELHGYNVVPACAGRKQAFVALTDTHLTMIFATEVVDIDAAERQFTDELDKLTTRREAESCQA